MSDATTGQGHAANFANASTGASDGMAKGSEPKKRKGGKGKKPSRKRLKLTDSNWEQAFLISYLEGNGLNLLQHLLGT